MRIFADGWSVDKDGPGQRWIVYLKGCDMRCLWCANPESVSPAKEILFHPDRASGPLEKVCAKGALHGKKLDRSVCASCDGFQCAEEWRHICFELAGRDVSPEWILRKALEAKAFFGRSGGVTFGGGEPSLQAAELLTTIKLLKGQGVNVVVESNASTPECLEIAKAVDLTIFDLKAVSNELHLKATGLPVAMVLENLSRAAKEIPALLIRIPLVTGVNDSVEEMDALRRFLAGLAQGRAGGLQAEVLRLHHLGSPKWKALGKDYPMEGVEVPSAKLAQSFVDALRASGIEAKLA